MPGIPRKNTYVRPDLPAAWVACLGADLSDVGGSCQTFAPGAASTVDLGMVQAAARLLRGGMLFCRIAFAKKNNFESAQAIVPSAFSLLMASEAPSTHPAVSGNPTASHELRCLGQRSWAGNWGRQTRLSANGEAHGSEGAQLLRDLDVALCARTQPLTISITMEMGAWP